MKNINKGVLSLIIGLFIFASCSEEFLDRPPEDQLTVDNYYQNSDQLNAATAALYNVPWFTYNASTMWYMTSIASGQLISEWQERAQFNNLNVQASNSNLRNAWQSFYSVVAQSNQIINNLPIQVSDQVPEDLVNRTIAEARFMRATAYFYLTRYFGDVPIIEDQSAISDDFLIPKHPESDVYKFIVKDYRFAMNNLPQSYGDGSGRVTEWSAKGMLSKVYLNYAGISQGGSRDQAKLDSARILAKEVALNSGLNLLTNYENLFIWPSCDNNQESLFAFQWIGCHNNWGEQNSNQDQLAYSSEVTGFNGWGAGLGVSDDLANEYEGGDLRQRPTMFLEGFHYDEILQEQGGLTYTAEDAEGSNTRGNMKKYIVGTPADNDGRVCNQSMGMNTYVLRLADVYLIWAEAALALGELTDGSQPLEYFNKVRNRAGLQALSASEVDEDAILHERKVEFGLEFNYWFTLMRLHDHNPAKARSMVESQERGTYNEEGNLESKMISVEDGDFEYPIPEDEVTTNPNLAENAEPESYYNN